MGTRSALSVSEKKAQIRREPLSDGGEGRVSELKKKLGMKKRIVYTLLFPLWFVAAVGLVLFVIADTIDREYFRGKP